MNSVYSIQHKSIRSVHSLKSMRVINSRFEVRCLSEWVPCRGADFVAALWEDQCLASLDDTVAKLITVSKAMCKAINGIAMFGIF